MKCHPARSLSILSVGEMRLRGKHPSHHGLKGFLKCRVKSIDCHVPILGWMIVPSTLDTGGVNPDVSIGWGFNPNLKAFPQHCWKHKLHVCHSRPRTGRGTGDVVPPSRIFARQSRGMTFTCLSKADAVARLHTIYDVDFAAAWARIQEMGHVLKLIKVFLLLFLQKKKNLA